MTAYKGLLYFAADDGGDEKELGAADGTLTGTSMVMDINENAGSHPIRLTVY